MSACKDLRNRAFSFTLRNNGVVKEEGNWWSFHQDANGVVKEEGNGDSHGSFSISINKSVKSPEFQNSCISNRWNGKYFRMKEPQIVNKWQLIKEMQMSRRTTGKK